MSHFTHIKTRFQNSFYLKKVLTKLNINYTPKYLKNSIIKPKILSISHSTQNQTIFKWNGNEYEFIVDLEFWKQDYSVETFLNKIAQQYTTELIIGENKKMGFEPIIQKINSDGSNSLILERWNTKKKY